MKFELKSPSFLYKEEIPERFTGEGSDESPVLEWENTPKGTQELALICEDPDAPQAEPWVHWLLYNIPGDVTKLPAAIPNKDRLALPPGAMQGMNSFGFLGYGGPMPPEGHGWHRYFFRLYALDADLTVSPGMTKAELLSAMEGHVLEIAELMGRYKREKNSMKKAG